MSSWSVIYCTSYDLLRTREKYELLASKISSNTLFSLYIATHFHMMLLYTFIDMTLMLYINLGINEYFCLLSSDTLVWPNIFPSHLFVCLSWFKFIIYIMLLIDVLLKKMLVIN